LVTTDGKFPSVFTDWITDGNVSVVKKRVVDVLAGYFFRRNHRRIQKDSLYRFEMADPCGDVLIVLSESSTVSPTDIPSGKSSVKVNICLLHLPSPPLFLLLPNPNSPHLQTTSPPSSPNKNLPHISTTSYISWSFVVTASVFWFTEGFYQFL